MNSLHDLTRKLGGELFFGGVAYKLAAVPVGQIVTDSRQVEPGNVFWALRGPTHDGNDFVDEAFARGAAGAVVTRTATVPEDRWVVRVDDAQQALQQWAQHKREHFGGTVIAVTGSQGKTTARQMIDAVLRSRLSGTSSPKNYNNHVGLPLSMFAIEPNHDYAVLELGAGRLGEIASLAKLCIPKVGVITQVGDAHLGGFGSRQGIAQAKAELLAALPPDGRAVLGDDPWLRVVAQASKAQITWVGTDTSCDVRATDVISRQGVLKFRVADCPFEVPVWGQHNLISALVAVAVGQMMGFDLEEAARALRQFQPIAMRCQVIEARGATIINDAYNSSPMSMRAALQLLSEFDTTGRRIVVAGEMAELGTESVRLHWQMGKQTVTLGEADLLIACGRFARYVAAGARAAGLPEGRTIICASTEEAQPYLGQAVQPGDVVLVKGSRVMAMERIVEALREYPRRRVA